MRLDRHVATPPSKPTMIFDGDCNFCTRWIRRWREATGDGVEYLPFQDPAVQERYPELPRELTANAVHLIGPDGTVSFGAEAVFQSLAYHPDKGRWLRWYRNSQLFARLTEAVYRFVAKHRLLFSWLTRKVG